MTARLSHLQQLPASHINAILILTAFLLHRITMEQTKALNALEVRLQPLPSPPLTTTDRNLV